MFSFVLFAAALALRLHGASAAPQTFFSNSTSASLTRPTVMASALETALYLTATSTSTESDDGSSLTEAPAESTDKKIPIEVGTSDVPPATSPSLAGNTTSSAFIPLHLMSLSPWALETAKGLLPVVTTSPASAAESIDIKPSPSSAPAGGEPPPTKTNPPEAATTVASPLVTENEDGVVSIMAAHFLSPEAGMAPTTTTAPSEESVYNAPDIMVSANNLLPSIFNQAAPASKSIITPSPSPVATIPTVPVPFTAQGDIIPSSIHLPAILLDTNNAAGSKILITSALILPTTSADINADINAPALITINDQTITPNAQSQYIISSQTLNPGSSITLGSDASSTVLALHTSGGTTALIYGPSTSILGTTNTRPPALTVGFEIITPEAQSHYIISGSTLLPGSTVTIGSGSSTTVLALQTSSGITALVYDHSTSILSAAATINPPALTIGSETITPNAQSQYMISGSTLSPGSTITLDSGSSTTVLALQTSSGTTALIYGPSTSIISSPPTTVFPPAITIGSQTITANSKSQYIIGSQTLTPGGVVTVSGTAVSLAGGLSDVVIGSSTATLGPYITAGTTPPAITIGSETITANSKTQYIIGSQTLTPGGVVTVNGTAVSLAAGVSDVVVGSSTEALGPYITAAFGSGGVGNGTGVQGFATGGVEGRGRGRVRVCMVGVCMVVGFVGVW